ncbi:MAG: hypothetical protein WAU00_18050 [Caldilinea sp.]
MMGHRILLFDDDYLSMEPLKEAIEDYGYTVVLTAAQEILDQLTVERFDLISVDFMIHPETPALEGEGVIANVHYPGVSWQETGLEFLRRLRRGDYEGIDGQGTARTTPAIILSATADPDETYDAQVIFEKPFDLDEVITALETLLQT